MMKFTDEQVSRAYQATPAHVREFIEEGHLLDVIELLSTTMALPVDKEIELGALLRNSIIGLMGPKDLGVALAELGMTSAQATTILEQMKEKVFEVLKEAPSPALPTPLDTLEEEVVPSAQSVLPSVNMLVGLSEQKQVVNLPAPSLPQKPIPYSPAGAVPETVRPRTMVSDVEAMQPVAAKVTTTTMRPSVPASNPPTLPKPPTPTAPALPSQPQKPVLGPNQKDVHEDMKKYGVDPYRESVG